jgi:hypothetical protein
MEFLLNFSGVDEEYEVLVIERKYKNVYFLDREQGRPFIRSIHALYWLCVGWEEWVLQDPMFGYPYDKHEDNM